MFERTSKESLGMSGDGYVYLLQWQAAEDGLEVWAFEHWSEALDAGCEKYVVGVFMLKKLTSRQQMASVRNTIRILDYRKSPPALSGFQNAVHDTQPHQ